MGFLSLLTISEAFVCASLFKFPGSGPLHSTSSCVRLLALARALGRCSEHFGGCWIEVLSGMMIRKW